MSYLKDLPCAGCGTESTYHFPDKPTAHYCYCEFRFEIGEQIARDDEIFMVAWNCPRTHFVGMEGCDYCSGFFDAMEIAAAIARGEK